MCVCVCVCVHVHSVSFLPLLSGLREAGYSAKALQASGKFAQTVDITELQLSLCLLTVRIQAALRLSSRMQGIPLLS